MSEKTTAEKTLEMMSRIGRLESLPRTGWIVGGVQNPESVAAHAYEVCVLAVWLADRVEEPVDIAELVRIALAHDAGEALLTDLPAPVKARIGASQVASAESQAVAEIFDGEPSWVAAHAAYVASESTEARLVKAADKIQMLVRALQYDRQNRGDVARFFEKDYPDFGFALVGEIFDAIKKYHREQNWHASDLD